MKDAATVRGARSALAFYNRIGEVMLRALENPGFVNVQLNGDGSHFPSHTTSVVDMLNVWNFGGVNRVDQNVWLEVAVFLEVNGIPLATVSCPLRQEPLLFLVDKEPDRIVAQVEADLVELINWK